MLFGYIKLLFGWLNLILITILVRINETWRELHWKFISWFIHWLTSLTKYGWSLKLIYRGRLLVRDWSSTGLNKICWKIREGRKKTVVRKEYQVSLIIMYEMLCTILYENQLSSEPFPSMQTMRQSESQSFEREQSYPMVSSLQAEPGTKRLSIDSPWHGKAFLLAIRNCYRRPISVKDWLVGRTLCSLKALFSLPSSDINTGDPGEFEQRNRRINMNKKAGYFGGNYCFQRFMHAQ